MRALIFVQAPASDASADPALQATFAATRDAAAASKAKARGSNIF